MAELTRMNLSAIKKIDPYAKDIVDTSSHVAFYTFNSEQNEWEKTDVEGAFFIYNRNAEPFHSIFINNRLNTTSFVEPITGQLELQSQPPFLLYRNERSRIRGFWFYNSEECDRISQLVNRILQKGNGSSNGIFSFDRSITSTELSNASNVNLKMPNTNIFKMLSKAQQDFNAQNSPLKPNENTTPCNVLQFFASAKHTTTTSEDPFNRVLPLSVDQLEKQHRPTTPNSKSNNALLSESRLSPTINMASTSLNRKDIPLNTLSSSSFISNSGLNAFTGPQKLTGTPFTANEAELCLKRLLVGELRLKPEANSKEDTKPALMPPTMFDKPIQKSDYAEVDSTSLQCTVEPVLHSQQQPLNPIQFVQAFNYLMQSDKDFVRKLHEAYLKSFSKSLFDPSTTYN